MTDTAARQPRLITNRRQLLAGSAALAALATTACIVGPARAQRRGEGPTEVPVEDLMKTVDGLPDVALGPADAKVAVVEYASMTCGHCAKFHKDVFPQIKTKYIDSGKIRFIMREFPLDAWAAAAFSLARCAEATTPGAYYTLTSAFFENQPVWTASVDAFVAFVQPYGFTAESFNACIDDQTILAGIEWSYDRGVELGVNATPTFFINGRRQIGGISFADLSRMIDGLIP